MENHTYEFTFLPALLFRAANFGIGKRLARRREYRSGRLIFVVRDNDSIGDDDTLVLVKEPHPGWLRFFRVFDTTLTIYQGTQKDGQWFVAEGNAREVVRRAVRQLRVDVDLQKTFEAARNLAAKQYEQSQALLTATAIEKLLEGE